MLLLLAVHAAVAALLAPVVARAGSRALLLVALPPAAAAGYAGWALPAALDGRARTDALAWIPGLGVDFAVRADPLAMTMTLLVGLVGAAVAVYGVGYFARELTARTAVGLLGFAGAMLGLVLADDLLALYVFWELTTVCSFVLIGDVDRGQVADTAAEARRAAVQALLTTTAGGLVMLVGFLLLGRAAGTFTISAIVATPPSGPAVTVALVFVLIGAFAKSALVPLHGWLPAAMVAPTPVSAYLHAAAMVNAGVYLIARLAPGFAQYPVWQPLVLTVGAVTVLLGGYRALRQHDLKRLLAFSTISQLGFLTVLLGAGQRTAALAGIGLLVAHGLAKAALFGVAGAIEHRTGTRDLRELDTRAPPAVLAAAVLAGASLAGVPPLLGYVAKESAYTAFVHGGIGNHAVLAVLVLGSALTLAYTLRFLLGCVGSAGRQPQTGHGPWPQTGHDPWLLAGPPLALAAGGLVLGVLPRLADTAAAAWAGRFPILPGAEPDHQLELWHGLQPALGLSLAGLALGTVAHLRRRGLAAAQHRLAGVLPRIADVDRGYQLAFAALRRSAVATTARVQVGSPPLYLVVIALTVLALPGSALVVALAAGELGTLAAPVPWVLPAEAVLAALVLAGCVAIVFPRRRLAVVLILGFVGYGVAGLFVLRGAPDLALTQLLVESLTLVAFVLVLRRIPEGGLMPQTSYRRVLRTVVAVALGVFVGAVGLITSAARDVAPVSDRIVRLALPETGASNVLTAILVDFRALDTVAESSVLLVALVGVSSLVLVNRRYRAGPEPPGPPPRRTDYVPEGGDEPA